MSEQDRNLAEMDDADFERHRAAQTLIQEAIDEVLRDAQGRQVHEVEDLLVAALAARGIGAQPPRWLETVATMLATGHRYIEDTSQA